MQSENLYCGLSTASAKYFGIYLFLVNGCLESAGHRATLFSRLLDEHNVISAR